MPESYQREKPPRKSYDEVVHRVNHLKRINQPYLSERTKIRKLMNGGKGAIDVLLGDLPTDDDTLPAANHIKSGIERFSEMISPAPDLRIDPPGNTDSDNAREAAEKRERIVASYDESCNLEAQLVQGSLWCPGYGFFSWKLCERRNLNGYRYPKAELRDPYMTYPAAWGVDQRPKDIAYERWVDPETLARTYPKAKKLSGSSKYRRLQGGAVDLSTMGKRGYGDPGWAGTSGGIEIIEYVDAYGTYVYAPSIDGFLDVFKHPLARAPIVVPRRFNFDQLRGQFTDVIGLAGVMAKLTLLTQIIMEDAAFAPVIVSGRMDGPFKKGRDAVNKIEGGDAKYLYQNIPYQMFAEIDRIENHLRSTAGYSKQADGQSPMSFVTGEGLEELGSSLSRQVERYQLAFSGALVDLDRMRLEWDERAYGGERRPLEGELRGATYSEKYDPAKDIKGRYRTRRVYGIMAAWDDARKIVGGLQLLAAGAIDITTLRENLRGLDNIPRIEERSRKDKAQEVLFNGLLADAEQGDPKAKEVALEVYKSGDLAGAIEEYYGTDEEEQLLPQQQPLPQKPPGVGTVLSRLTQGGSAEGGAQTVQTVPGR